MVGITVVLYNKTVTGYDSFNNPIYEESSAEVDNVLVGQPSTDDVLSSTNLYGKQIEYMVGIPKGDTHNWEDSVIEFFEKKYRTFGNVIQGIEANVPTPWHKKIRVERYE